ncbi:hypothetical protein DWZ23_04485, partial [Escherichia coli]
GWQSPEGVPLRLLEHWLVAKATVITRRRPSQITGTLDGRRSDS